MRLIIIILLFSGAMSAQCIPDYLDGEDAGGFFEVAPSSPGGATIDANGCVTDFDTCGLYQFWYIVNNDCDPPCYDTSSVYMAKCCPLEVEADIEAAICGNNNGAIDLMVGGQYTYFWQNGLITQNVELLYSGTYGVTITDAVGCQLDTLFTVPDSTTVIDLNISCTIN